MREHSERYDNLDYDDDDDNDNDNDDNDDNDNDDNEMALKAFSNVLV